MSQRPVGLPYPGNHLAKVSGPLSNSVAHESCGSTGSSLVKAGLRLRLIDGTYGKLFDREKIFYCHRSHVTPAGS